VLVLLDFPFSFWSLTKFWHGPIVTWLARHPLRALTRLGPSLQWVPAAVATLVALMVILATWWLTTAPTRGETHDRWRWPAVRWSFFAVVFGYPMLYGLSLALSTQLGRAPLIHSADIGLAVHVLFAAILVVIFTELRDDRAFVLALALVGIAALEQLVVATAGSSGVREALIGTSLLLLRTGIAGYLLWKLGWPHERTVPRATVASSAAAADVSPSPG
jgi:hypothetical protein